MIQPPARPRTLPESPSGQAAPPPSFRSGSWTATVRVVAGLARARKEGRIGGRPKVIVSPARFASWQIRGSVLCRLGHSLGAAG
jgi:hypothetical protein